MTSISPDGDAPSRTYVCYLIAADADDRVAAGEQQLPLPPRRAKGRTYVGVTNDSARRLRQHNGELAGGAKATRSKRWRYVAKVGPFGHVDALRFEWAWKHSSRRVGGVEGRILGLNELVCRARWTSKSPPAEVRPLTVRVFKPFFDDRSLEVPYFSGLPTYVDVVYFTPPPMDSMETTEGEEEDGTRSAKAQKTYTP
jgi:hypothetical protein